MNITDIQICSPGQEENTLNLHLTFDLNAIDRTSPFILKKATGLEPDEIMRTYNDGPAFYRLRPKQRTIGLNIRLNPNYTGELTIGDLRDYLYKMIAYNTNATIWNTDTRLELRFMNGETYIGSIYGVVSRYEADIFSNNSDVTLHLECDDPFIRSTEEIDLSDNITLGSNVSHEYFNGITYNVESSFACTDNNSTAPHGFKLTAECISEPPEVEGIDPKKFIIWDNRNSLYYIFSTTLDFLVGDIVHFSSEEDNRYIYVTRGFTKHNLINAIYWGSIWPMISPGENFFEVSEGFNITSVSHRESYWGV